MGFRKVCRFAFPRVAKATFTLRTVVEATAGRKALRANSRLYDLPCQQNEKIIINDYNPAILLAWEGNMDIQYIGGNAVYSIGILLSILPNLKEVMQLLRLVISL